MLNGCCCNFFWIAKTAKESQRSQRVFLSALCGKLRALCDPVGVEMVTYFTISLVAFAASFLDRKDRKGIAKIAKGSS
jgi:hypothetical protein